MTNILHWRKMTWALVLWSVYIAIWTVVAGSGPLWFATRPLFQQGRGLNGPFIWPSWTHWRVVDLHRSNRDTEARRDAG